MQTIRNGLHDPFYDQAFEAQVFQTFRDDNIFFLWQDSPAVAVGSDQNICREVRVGTLRRRGIPVIRRMSGGGTVCGAAPASGRLLRRNLTAGRVSTAPLLQGSIWSAPTALQAARCSPGSTARRGSFEAPLSAETFFRAGRRGHLCRLDRLPLRAGRRAGGSAVPLHGRCGLPHLRPGDGRRHCRSKRGPARRMTNAAGGSFSLFGLQISQVRNGLIRRRKPAVEKEDEGNSAASSSASRSSQRSKRTG